MMLYIIFIILFFIILGIVLFIIGILKDKETFKLLSVFSFLFVFLFLICILSSYVDHYNDVGTIRGQHYKIKVYEDQRVELQNTLNSFSYPNNPDFLLNSDSPVASIVKEIARINHELTNVKAQVSDARINIEKRKVGPFGFIVKWIGEE